MKTILILGSGAREQAIAKALSRSVEKPVIFAIGTTMNPGLKADCQQYVVGDILNEALVLQYARKWQCDLAIIGPEAPLECGMADALWAAGVSVIGPKKALARIETSKQYARDLMKKYHIPGLPRYAVVRTLDEASLFLNELGEGHYVIKADGLMGGKGVKVAGDHLASIDEALQFCETLFKQASTVLIEEKLIGQEFSFMVFSDGSTVVPMPLVQDHKRAYVGDLGPNTGGMGSYTCEDHSLPFVTADDKVAALAINEAVIHALQQETGEPYKGILYGSFIVTRQGVSVIEFNARFGDPEALNILALLTTDFLGICVAIVSGTLKPSLVQFENKASVCKYVVPEGYPDAPLINSPIEILALDPKVHCYLGAVHETSQGLLATGSRIAGLVGVADNLQTAEALAESGVLRIQGKVFHRPDIGTQALIEQRIEMMRTLRDPLCV